MNFCIYLLFRFGEGLFRVIICIFLVSEGSGCVDISRRILGVRVFSGEVLYF